jgi:hypothetical protein
MIGIGPEGMKPKDILCILYGATVPFIIQPSQACLPTQLSHQPQVYLDQPILLLSTYGIANSILNDDFLMTTLVTRHNIFQPGH